MAQKLWYKKKSPLHGSGLFAKNDIKKGAKVIQYIGDKVTKKEGDKRADKQIRKAKKDKNNGMVYVFELNKRYDIDGDVDYNFAKYINHSCNPNCEVYGTGLKVWVYAIKDIKKGEELTYDYGFSFDEDYKDFPCRCRSKNCVGYIVREESRWRINKKFAMSNKKNLINNFR